jgi:predicted nucleic acid-binding protein
MTPLSLAVDSDVLIRAVEGDTSEPDVRAANALVFKRPPHVSFVVTELILAEVLVLPLRNADVELARFYRRLLTDLHAFRLVPISRGIVMEAARLRSLTHLKLPDAIHLATATRTGAKSLVTMDARIRSPGVVPTLRPDSPELAALLA